MNQMVLYSKVVTIRDKQLEENKIMEQKWHDEQRQLDLVMEIERLKKLQAIEDIEAARVEANRKGAAVIIDQMQNREVLRQEEKIAVKKENK